MTPDAQPIGRLSYVFMEVTDVDAAARFYGDGLGLRMVDATPGAFAFLAFGGESAVQLALYGRGQGEGSGRLLAIDVPDLAAAAARLARAGIQTTPPERVPGGSVVRFEDLDGNHFELHERDAVSREQPSSPA